MPVFSNDLALGFDQREDATFGVSVLGVTDVAVRKQSDACKKHKERRTQECGVNIKVAAGSTWGGGGELGHGEGLVCGGVSKWALRSSMNCRSFHPGHSLG